MKLVASYQTPEGLVTVHRYDHKGSERLPRGVYWVVYVPGLERERYWSRKRDAMQHAGAVVRLLSPLPARRSLLEAWDKVRTYG